LRRKSLFTVLSAIGATGLAPSVLAGPSLITLHSFNGTDGSNPETGLVADSAGNLYGVTLQGGAYSGGTAFELSGSNHRTFTTLAAFNNSNVPGPYGPLTFDAAGNLLGTTVYGGSNRNGSIFSLSGPNHQVLTTLFSFNGSNGSKVETGLVADGQGNFWGMTEAGGTANDGTIYELSGQDHQTLTTVFNFNGSNGSQPVGNLVLAPDGNFYGATPTGGADGDGTVFELSGPNHQTFTTLMNFTSANVNPIGPLAFDSAGDLFGTTFTGGPNNAGTVFELSGPGYQTLTTLFNFNGSNGLHPHDSVIIDTAGNLFGLTAFAGSGVGNAFELSGPGYQNFTNLVTAFGGSVDPYGQLFADSAGNLIGVTASFSNGGNGTIFEITGSGFVVPEPTLALQVAVCCVALLRRRSVRKRIAI
jgi:uncharacterized repeat protein (TIGR03803 family)